MAVCEPMITLFTGPRSNRTSDGMLGTFSNSTPATSRRTKNTFGCYYRVAWKAFCCEKCMRVKKGSEWWRLRSDAENVTT